MDFDEYQKRAAGCDFYEKTSNVQAAGFFEKILGLTGEAGEVADKFKKIVRDKNGAMSDGDKDAIVKELGDVLWYVGSIARYLDVPLSEVAERNVEKLEDRQRRNTLHGEGDER